MKIIRFFIPVLFLTAGIIISCNNVQNDTQESQNIALNKDLEINGLHGKVKSVVEYFVNLESNEKMDSFMKEFNENGILITIQNNIGKHHDLIEITCDSKGFPESGKREYSGIDGKIQIYSYSYKCNSKGLIIEQKITMDLSESTHCIIYNENGFETSRRSSNSGVLTSVDTTEYDEKDRKIRFAHLDPETLKPSYEVLITYSEDGREIIETWYSNGTSSRRNKKNEELDKFGNPTSRIMIRDNDTLPTWNFKYTYDSQNNWIERIGFKADTIGSKWKRDIEYY